MGRAINWLASFGSCLIVTAAAAQETLTYDVVFNDTILAERTDGFTLGDRFILNDVLRRLGEDVGRVSGVCTITDIQGVALCAMTFELPDGAIAGQFINTPPPEKTFAITGGTGVYLGRTGYGVLVEAGDGTGTVTFHFID